MTPPVAATPRERQEELGQFLTASRGRFMASMLGPLPQTVRLLDAGAGAGALTLPLSLDVVRSAMVFAQLTRHSTNSTRSFGPLAATMRKCEHLCSDVGIRFKFTIHPDDFIREMSRVLLVICSARPRLSSMRRSRIRHIAKSAPSRPSVVPFGRRSRDEQPLHRLYRTHSAVARSRWSTRRHHTAQLLQWTLLSHVPRRLPQSIGTSSPPYLRVSQGRLSAMMVCYKRTSSFTR